MPWAAAVSSYRSVALPSRAAIVRLVSVVFRWMWPIPAEATLNLIRTEVGLTEFASSMLRKSGRRFPHNHALLIRSRLPHIWRSAFVAPLKRIRRPIIACVAVVVAAIGTIAVPTPLHALVGRDLVGKAGTNAYKHLAHPAPISENSRRAGNANLSSVN